MRFETKKYNIKAKIEEDIRICHITDIHYSRKYPLTLFLDCVQIIKSQKVNYICITGDLLDDALIYEKVDMNPFYHFFETLGEIAPVLCIIGNHDQINHKWFKRKYQKAIYLEEKLSTIHNVHILHNSQYKDKKITCIGYIQTPSLYLKELKQEKEIIREINTIFPKSFSHDTYTIFLSHSPLTLGKETVQKKIPFLKSVDLILAGHTHDGLTPSFFPSQSSRGIISPNKKMFSKNLRGILKRSTPIIISGGLIKLSHSAGILRYFRKLYPSSITFIEINGNE